MQTGDEIGISTHGYTKGQTGDEIGGTNWSNIMKTNDPEGSLTQLTESIKKAMENHIPRRTGRTYTEEEAR